MLRLPTFEHPQVHGGVSVPGIEIKRPPKVPPRLLEAPEPPASNATVDQGRSVTPPQSEAAGQFRFSCAVVLSLQQKRPVIEANPSRSRSDHEGFAKRFFRHCGCTGIRQPRRDVVEVVGQIVERRDSKWPAGREGPIPEQFGGIDPLSVFEKFEVVGGVPGSQKYVFAKDQSFER